MQHTLQSIRRFAHEHDDIPAFHAGFLVLTLLCALLFPLGAFALLVLFHVTLDVIKYRDYHGYDWKGVLEGVLRESMVDITLLLVGLVFTVYLHASVGVASVSGLMRTELFLLQLTGTTIPKLSILHHFLKIMSHVHHYMEHVHPRMRKGFSRLDHMCFYFSALAVILLIAAPMLMNIDAALEQQILLEELILWKF